MLAGSVLMVAALLKLAGTNVSAFAQYGWFLSSNVQIAAVGWELLLGAALIFGLHRPVTWSLAILTFTVFAGVSSYLGIIGQASCGCFGTIEASPWAAFGVDVAMLILLAIFRPRFSTAELRSASRESGKWAFSLAAVLAVTLGAGVILYGSPAAALAKLRGDTVSVSSEYLDFGSGSPGETLNSVIRVHNWTDQPVKIIGGSSDCSCATTLDLPVIIPPGKSVELTIQLILPQSHSGVFTRHAVLWIDNDTRRMIHLQLGSRIGN